MLKHQLTASEWEMNPQLPGTKMGRLQPIPFISFVYPSWIESVRSHRRPMQMCSDLIDCSASKKGSWITESVSVMIVRTFKPWRYEMPSPVSQGCVLDQFSIFIIYYLYLQFSDILKFSPFIQWFAFCLHFELLNRFSPQPNLSLIWLDFWSLKLTAIW